MDFTQKLEVFVQFLGIMFTCIMTTYWVVSEEIFVATMKFCTRFLYENYRAFGSYKYVWAWWFPRQMAMEGNAFGIAKGTIKQGESRD